MNATIPIISARPDIARPIIAKFGGVDRFCELTGHPRARVAGWVRIGWIDDKYRPWLLAVALREGIQHTPWDYIAHLVEYPIAA
jgi:hypothetical protein